MTKTSKDTRELNTLSDEQLDKVTGGGTKSSPAVGKPTPGTLSFSHYYDLASPELFR
jgi:hypothetical protein